jgi:hypothetical protein
VVEGPLAGQDLGRRERLGGDRGDRRLLVAPARPAETSIEVGRVTTAVYVRPPEAPIETSLAIHGLPENAFHGRFLDEHGGVLEVAALLGVWKRGAARATLSPLS